MINERSDVELIDFLLSIIGNAPYGIIATDLQGEITIINDQALKHLNKDDSIDKVIGQSIFEYLNWPRIEAIMADCLKTGRKKFDQNQLFFRKKIFSVKGRIILNGYLIITEDITNRIKQQEALKNSELKQKDINKELEGFLYRSSHDLRGPVASSFGLINLLKSSVKDNESNQLVHLMEKLMIKMDNIITELRDVIKIKHGKIKLNPVDIHTITQEQIDSLHAISDKNLQVELNIDQSKEFYTDKELFQCILNNLLSNAVTYRRQDTKPEIKIHVAVKKAYTHIQVSDNGIGISKDQLPLIFNLFHRAHEESQGSGMGLYIVKNAIRKLKGEISVKSKEGKGTVFFVKLPHLQS